MKKFIFLSCFLGIFTQAVAQQGMYQGECTRTCFIDSSGLFYKTSRDIWYLIEAKDSMGGVHYLALQVMDIPTRETLGIEFKDFITVDELNSSEKSKIKSDWYCTQNYMSIITVEGKRYHCCRILKT